MFWTRADGAGKPQPLTQSENQQSPSSLTPDGTRLVFSELTPGAGGEIRTAPVESGSGQMRAGETRLFLKTSAGYAFPAFSPDGRWLAYGGRRSRRLRSVRAGLSRQWRQSADFPTPVGRGQ
jgi:Tol biopolymer transport system component